MTNQDKATVYSALLRLFDTNTVLTDLEKRDLLNEITKSLTGDNLEKILNGTENKRKLLLKRGTYAENDGYTGTPGEVTIDTTKQTLRVHDGETVGGTPLARADHVHDDVEQPAAGLDLENLTDSDKEIITALSIPRGDFIDIGNTTIEYVAPTNGYVYFAAIATGSTMGITISNVTTGMDYTNTMGSYSGFKNTVMMPVRKNDKVRFSLINATSTNKRFYSFI